MKYKMIVSDFDGTLANSDDIVTKETINLIKEYIANGGVFSVSTGRPYKGTKRRFDELEFFKTENIPVMTFQGALVTDSITEEVLYKVPMDSEVVRKTADFCDKNGLYFHCYTKDNIYTKEKCKYATLYADYIQAHDYFNYVGDVSKFIGDTRPELLKMCVMCGKEETENVAAALKDCTGYEFVSAAEYLLECADKSAGKGNTMLKVAKNLGISPDQTIAIGDSMNDYSMVSMAGIGAAVDNADPKLKTAAKIITPSNNDNGVAYIIKRALENTL